ncbi:MAG: MASE2 domain-containing protein, partial [Colwellia sp.]
MAFVILAIGGVFMQKQVPTWSWVMLLSYGLIWPHIAHLWAKKSKDPFKSEKINLFIDAFFMGFWVPLISFDFLPSIAVIVMGLLSVVSAIGFKKMILAFLVECLGVLAACLIVGMNIEFQNTIYSTMVSLPI